MRLLRRASAETMRAAFKRLFTLQIAKQAIEHVWMVFKREACRWKYLTPLPKTKSRNGGRVHV